MWSKTIAKSKLTWYNIYADMAKRPSRRAYNPEALVWLQLPLYRFNMKISLWDQGSKLPSQGLFFLPLVSYCNSSSNGCQGPLKIKIITQNLIRSKQRKGEQGGDHRRWNRYISTDVCKLKHGFANFEKIKRSLNKLSLNACNLSKKVIQW